jgi:hypothetical protein
MKQQTAVEWLIEQFKEYDFEDSPTMCVMQIPSWVLEKKELQAKEMEKQQEGYSEEEVLKFSEWFAFELTHYGYPTEENIIKALKEIKRILKTNKI